MVRNYTKKQPGWVEVSSTWQNPNLFAWHQSTHGDTAAHTTPLAAIGAASLVAEPILAKVDHTGAQTPDKDGRFVVCRRKALWAVPVGGLLRDFARCQAWWALPHWAGASHLVTDYLERGQPGLRQEVNDYTQAAITAEWGDAWPVEEEMPARLRAQLAARAATCDGADVFAGWLAASHAIEAEVQSDAYNGGAMVGSEAYRRDGAKIRANRQLTLMLEALHSGVYEGWQPWSEGLHFGGYVALASMSSTKE